MTDNHSPFSPNGAGAPAASEAPLLPLATIERPRDAHDQPDVSTHVYGPSLPDPVPISNAELNRELGLIRVRDPQGAHTVATFYKDKMLPAIKKISQRREEEARLLPARVRLSQTNNAAIDTKQRGIEKERERALLPYRETLVAIDEELAARHAAASQAFSALGAPYDSRTPSDTGLPFPKPRSKEAIAAEQRLPWPLPATLAQPLVWAEWALTLIVGSVLGVSALVAFHLARADALPFHLGLCFIAALVGTGLTEAAKRSTRLSSHCAGQLLITGPRGRFWAALAVTLVLAISFIVVDASVLHSGAIAQVRAREMLERLGGRGPHGSIASGLADDAVYWFAAFIITPGLLALATLEGFVGGRHDATDNLLISHQESNLAAREESFRTDPQVQAARGAFSDVQEGLRQEGALSEEMKAVAAPYNARWKQYEEERMPGEKALRQQSEHLIQDIQHDAFGELQELERLLKQARDKCLPPQSQ